MVCASGSRPNRLTASAQPASAPGVATDEIAGHVGAVGGVVVQVAGDRVEHVRLRRERHHGVVVEERHVAGPAIPNGEEARPERRDHHRLDHRQREQGRHGRVDGVAAVEQHLDAGRRCQRVIGGDHRPGCHHFLLVRRRHRVPPACPKIAGGCRPAKLALQARRMGSRHDSQILRRPAGHPVSPIIRDSCIVTS